MLFSVFGPLADVNKPYVGSLSYANASYLLSLLGTSDGDKRHINEMGKKFPDAAAFLR